MNIIDETIDAIEPVDPRIDQAIRARLDDLTKPPGSLGRLEELCRWYGLIRADAGCTGGGKRICAFAADHGVCAQGVSAFPSAVTAQMVRNMLAGGAAVNVLAAQAGAEVEVIDVGVADDLAGAPAHLLRRKVRPGTADISCGPAMSRDDTEQALAVGIDLAAQAATDGIGLLGTGEMGIGNTTPSAALFSCLLGLPVAEVTGRGTGIDDARLTHKIAIIERALRVNHPDPEDPVATLAAVGGLEIAAIAGLCLGAAARHIPVVVDGFISSAGALVALRLCPRLRSYLVFSHRSAEAGHRRVCRELVMHPVLDLDLRLGEGTGAALAIPIIDAALACYRSMATFSGAGISGREA